MADVVVPPPEIVTIVDKTAAFGIGVLQTVEIEDRRTQALILAPTRELALQIQKVVVALGDYLKVQ